MGLKKTCNRANELVFWPFMNKDIERMINKCETCQKYMRNTIKEPIIFHDIPQLRWTKLGMDIAFSNGKDYLIVVVC